MKIRKTTLKDLKTVLDVYAIARETMRKSGNPNQWQNNHPAKEIILEDIKNGNSYVIENNSKICGVFAFILGEDPTYQTIDGKWLNNQPYGTIHRIASNNQVKGVLNCCLNFCKTKIKNIKIDTHNDNLIMQHLLEKYGFSKCGIIYLEDGSPRIAYQKSFKD